MTKLFCIEIKLAAFNAKQDNLIFELVFDSMPTVNEFLIAFDNEASLRLREDCKEFRSRLVRGLRTFGIPDPSGLQDLLDDNRKSLTIPMVHANWYFNALSEDLAVSDILYGAICVAIRNLKSVGRP